MLRLFLISCLIASVNASLANAVREYRETKKGITLITYYGEDSERKLLDGFLQRLSKTLRKPAQVKIMIVVDYDSEAPWNAIIGYDTLRFDMKFIAGDCYRQKKDSVVEIILSKNPSINANYAPQKEIATDWSGSCEETKTELGLKIFFKWPLSESMIISFDRIYSLAKYGIEHLEEIKGSQQRVKIRYYSVWLLSMRTIDTTEIKKIPVQSLGFDPSNIKVKTKSPFLTWLAFSIIALGLILFLILRKAKARAKLNSHSS